MAAIKYLLMASRVIQDSATQRWSYIDVINSFIIPKNLTQIVNSFVIAGRLSGVQAGTVKVDVYIMAPNNTVLQSVNLLGPVVGGDVDFTANVPFITFIDIGRYYIRVFYNDVIIPDQNQFYFDVTKEL